MERVVWNFAVSGSLGDDEFGEILPFLVWVLYRTATMMK